MTKPAASSQTGRRLVTYTVLCSTAVALVATAAQLYTDYSREITDLDARLGEIEQSKAAELNHALWVRDDVLLGLQLQGLVATPGVERASVRSGGELIAQVGVEPDTTAQVKTVGITHLHRGQRVDLGTLRLEVSHGAVHAELWRHLLVILASNTLKTAVVAFLLLWIFRRLVTRHTDHLARYLDEQTGEGHPAPLVLDRPQDDGDELGRTVTAVNAMVERLSEHVGRLEVQREEIERLNGGLLTRVGELESFSYSLAHDLAGPLRTVHSFAEIVCEEVSDPEMCELLERMQGACIRMRGTIDGMLVLARISKEALRIQPVDLTALAREVFEALRAAEPSRAAELVVQEGLTTTGDARLLRAALDNLLGNAWKYSQSRPSTRIEFARGEVAGREGFYVRDNGVGFSPEHAARLFAPFERLHPEFSGHGIGLAVVRAVMTRHGGEVWADARPEEGATFAFTIGQPDLGPAPLPDAA